MTAVGVNMHMEVLDIPSLDSLIQVDIDFKLHAIGTEPFLMISSLVLDMVKLYGDPIYVRDVVVINEKEQQSRHYHLALLESVERGHVLMEKSNIFEINVKGRRECVVSQDFAESILRRGAVGIMLEETDIRKEQLYGK